MFIVKPHSGVPIYRQLVEQIERMVASGQLPPGTALPSIREVAIKHAINPMTVSKAYSLLEAEGVLERHRGRPMTVASHSRTQSALAERIRQLDSQLDHLVLAARQLELSPADVVNELRKKWSDWTG